jgi:hypothetical protein
MVARNSEHSKEQQTYLDIHGQATARMCGHLRRCLLTPPVVSERRLYTDFTSNK